MISSASVRENAKTSAASQGIITMKNLRPRRSESNPTNAVSAAEVSATTVKSSPSVTAL